MLVSVVSGDFLFKPLIKVTAIVTSGKGVSNRELPKSLRLLKEQSPLNGNCRIPEEGMDHLQVIFTEHNTFPFISSVEYPRYSAVDFYQGADK
jgi:hypothetical protein